MWRVQQQPGGFADKGDWKTMDGRFHRTMALLTCMESRYGFGLVQPEYIYISRIDDVVMAANEYCNDVVVQYCLVGA